MPVLDPLDLATSTSEAAFATDHDGLIVFWNKAAEGMLGVPADHVLGKRCHDVICGQDLFGNRFCQETCALRRMARSREPLRAFEMDVRHVSGKMIRSRCNILVLRRKNEDEFAILHLLSDVEADRSDSLDIERAIEDISGRADPEAGSPAASQRGTELTRLTKRELQILRLMSAGTPTREIAAQLGISQTTVRNHVQSLLRKLDVHSKLEAVAYAYRHHLV